MDASSAMDIITKNMPTVTTSVSQIAPAVPPFDRENTLVVRENSHVKPSTMTYPTIEKKRNRRLSSCFLPSCQDVSTSADRWRDQMVCTRLMSRLSNAKVSSLNNTLLISTTHHVLDHSSSPLPAAAGRCPQQSPHLEKQHVARPSCSSRCVVRSTS